MSEEWRPIPGLPHHEASSLGRVRRTTEGKGRATAGLILRQKARSNGYVIVSISATKHFVHRLVCAAFHGAPAERMEASHENGDRADNRAANLRWRTRLSNEAMKEQHGTRTRGSRHGASRLCETDVLTIRTAYRIGLANQADIARHYRIARTSVGDIINRRTWRHVE